MNFGYNEVIRKRRWMASKKSKRFNRILIKFLEFFIFFVGATLTISIFFVIGTIKGIIDSAPDVSTLNVSPTSYSTTVYDADGNVITTLLKSGSNRQEIQIEDIPMCL